MLCQFSFWNYKSFRDETTLDFCPANISEHPDHLIEEPISKEKFLPIAVIYGPNGGGKTTVLDAFQHLRSRIFRINEIDEPSGELDINVVQPRKKARRDKTISFAFDPQCADQPTGWSVSFITEGYEYKYTLVMFAGQITEESLYAKNLKTEDVLMLYERKDSIVLGKDLQGIHVDDVDSSRPLLSLISSFYKQKHILNVADWFKRSKGLNYGSNIILENSLLLPEESNPAYKTFFKVLQSMGIEITNIDVEEDIEGSPVKIYTVYNYNGRKIRLEYSEESSGTQKIFSLLIHLFKSLLAGTPIFVDELDAKLHPKLLEKLISLYTDPEINTNGGQLIFTSHDLYTMDSKFLRRDEIWFAARRDDFSSKLYSLAEFRKDGVNNTNGKQPRKDENYSKQYIKGHYGADPYFQRIENWMVNHERKTPKKGRQRTRRQNRPRKNGTKTTQN